MTAAPVAGAGRAALGVVVLLGAMALAGCSTPGGIEVFPEGASQEAPLSAVNDSAVTGSAIVGPTRDGVQIRIAVPNLAMGQYRVVIHANGNCSSPNGFSAGPPLVLPGATRHVMADVPPALLGGDRTLTLTIRLSGVRLDGPDGISGKSIVLHAGATGSLDAQPGVPNNRIACGVIGSKVFRLL